LLGQTGFRQLALVATAAFALAGCDAAHRVTAGPKGTKVGRVERVSDGDTVRLVGHGRVRLIGIDTPEVFGKSECFGRQASRFVKRLLPPGRRVRYRVGIESRDRYGRLLAYFWLRDGRFLNLLLVQRGYALPLTIPPNVDYTDRFVAAARRARRAGRGLWSACDDRQPAR
jgi:micrococcal nuclease